MKLNNINLQTMGEFASAVSADPAKAQMRKRAEGEWNFADGEPQFRAVMPHVAGETTVHSDFAPPMGGAGLAPDPIQYCLFGLCACYTGTYVQIAAEQGVALRRVKAVVENQVDLTRAFGLSQNPMVKAVTITIDVEADAPREVLERIKAEAANKCPGVYCVSNPIPLTIELA